MEFDVFSHTARAIDNEIDVITSVNVHSFKKTSLELDVLQIRLLTELEANTIKTLSRCAEKYDFKHPPYQRYWSKESDKSDRK